MAPTRFTDWSGALEACYLDLAGKTDSVVVAGLSMGATLAVWLAARQPRVAAVAAVNGLFDPPADSFADMLRVCLDQGQDRLPGIGSDIAAPGVAEDHIVPPVSSDVLAARVAGPVERVTLERSFHVATLDYDGDLIVERSVEFALRVTAGLAL